MSDEKNRGMPIYLDPFDRGIANSMSEGEAEVNAWYPSNSAAQKLWRCLECLRDLEELLEEAVQQKNATKKKRRLKIAITPLHALISALDDLLNDILCNKETSRLMKVDEHGQINAIAKQFNLMLPHDRKAAVSVVRNKLSSHIDKKLHPNDARKIGDIISPSEFGRWLHICLHLVLDLTKLDIYWWACDPLVDGYVRLMQNEPFIVTFKVDNKELIEFAGLHIANGSPKNSIPSVVEALVKSSAWMFKPGQPRIGALKEDTKENWNTFLGNLALQESSKE
jgi:hypothetical protein